MRTKTLLLTAAAMAAGIITSQAQAVYSQNIVGYATQSLGSGYSMIETPFNVGLSNGANEVWGSSLQDGMTFVIWNGGGFDQTLYSPSLQSALSLPSPWMDPNTFAPLAIPMLTNGMGYFLYSPNAVTNVVAGAVSVAGPGNPTSVNPPATNNMPIPAGYALVGSAIPLGGSVTNGIFDAPLEDGSTFVIWNGGSYDQTLYSPSLQSALSLPSPWMDPNSFAPLDPPTLSVGQGFFLYSPNQTTWVQTLQGY
jgi:hypothetical protein